VTDEIPRTVLARYALRRAGKRLMNDLPLRPGFIARSHLPRHIDGEREIAIHAKERTSPHDDRQPLVGYVKYQLCYRCNRGWLSKIAVYDPWQRQRFAAWLVHEAWRTTQTYEWSTSGQLTEAKPFWAHIRTRAEGQFTPSHPCHHMQERFGERR